MGSEYSNKDNRPNWFMTFVLALILFGEMVVLTSMSRPYVTKHYPWSKTELCFSNIRELMIAVEMYNTDRMDKKGDLMSKLDIDKLIKSKYLKEKPILPETDCLYLSDGDLFDDGKVYCKLHGFYDKDKIEEIRKSRAVNERKKDLKKWLIYISLHVFPPLVYVIYSIMSGNAAYGFFMMIFVLIILLGQGIGSLWDYMI